MSCVWFVRVFRARIAYHVCVFPVSFCERVACVSVCVACVLCVFRVGFACRFYLFLILFRMNLLCVFSAFGVCVCCVCCVCGSCVVLCVCSINV